MYERLFQNAEIRDLFNQSHHGETGSQPKALAARCSPMRRNIDNLGALASGRGADRPEARRAEHPAGALPYVAEALLGAIKDVLGDAATDEILAAWGEAYWFLADLLIGRETAIYASLAAAPGGWNGWRDFARREQATPESEIIRSFVLRPDGRPAGPAPSARPVSRPSGWTCPGQHPLKRNYSISCAPNDRDLPYHRQAGGQAGHRGLASNWLHDQAEARHGPARWRRRPASSSSTRSRRGPVVLLSGGVGLTPMMSMLETIAARYPNKATHYVHGTLNGSTHAMKDRVRSLAEAHANIRATTFYVEPRPEDRQGEDFDHVGLITVDWLRANTPLEEAGYYLCGPRPFLRAFVGGLALAGVRSNRIHYEFFGPADEILAAA